MLTDYKLHGENFVTYKNDDIQEHCIEDEYFELVWGNAFPSNYFQFKPLTHMSLRYYPNNAEDFNIESIETIIDEMNFNQQYSVGTGFKYIRYANRMDLNLFDCMSELLQVENDLLKFKKIKKITVVLNVKKNVALYILKYNFTPKIYYSSKILDNLMSN